MGKPNFSEAAGNLSLHKFYFDAMQKAIAKKNMRYGQAMFNHLAAVRPDLAKAVEGSDMDPFYVESLKDPRWDRFVAYIEKNWYGDPSTGEAPPKSDLLKVKELLLGSSNQYSTSKTHASQGGFRTSLTMETLVSREKIIFQFSHEDKLVGIETDR